MNQYEEKMLVLLAEKYRKSKKDNKTGMISRRTQAKPSELYKNYNRNDADLEQIEAVNQAAEECRKKGFLTYKMNGFSSEIMKIYLVDEKISEVEQYLTEHYQYEPKYVKQQYVERMIETYGGKSPVAGKECEKLKRILDRNRVPKDYLQTEEILKALVFIENNEWDLYLREASMLIYGSSKYLEEHTLESVCRLLRAHWNRPLGEKEFFDEILEEYHITREKQKICLKGDVTIKIAGKVLEVGALEDGIEFFADGLEKLESVRVHTADFMTVENRTAYFRCGRSGASFFYLGGYATRFQRDFLKKVYRDNPEVRYLHFGDIDAGGFYIHEHLCRVTEIPFGMDRMSVRELEDERFSGCLQELTENDKKRLGALLDREEYRETAQYMLEKDVKLEQEIVSLGGESTFMPFGVR
ncbi:hypothetical protein D3Z51_13180 [Clostridiaceae bacterium]|nr:hypothetical protein [Clostridiaceae bacterium]RKI11192.1 hypothetical protein D7V81_14155 [bacterium 1XD21-70]